MTTQKPIITSLPPELFLSIFSHLPHRTIKTIISPLHSITRASASKSALQNLSLASKSLRSISEPHIFESVIIKSFSQLEEFAKGGGVGEKYGSYVRRIVMRWDAYGEIIKPSDYDLDAARTGDLVRKAMELIPNLRGLAMNFPGAIDSLGSALESRMESEHLQTIDIRNGRVGYAGDITALFHRIGKLSELQSVVIDGTCITDTAQPGRMLHLDKGDLENLVNLEIINVSGFNDQMLHGTMMTAARLTALTVKKCPDVTLSGTRRLIIEHGGRLQHLSLDIVKKWVQAGHRPDSEPEHEHELYRFSEDEHLCPVIRDYCTNLQILDISTNKICKEILFSASRESGAMTGGLPTPPGSPDLPPTRVVDIPTPPTDAAVDVEELTRAPMLPPPLFSFQNLSLFYRGEEERLLQMPPEKRQKLKRVKLQIPYDSSCFGAGMGGPSLQQRYTTLCDGSPAKELLEVAKRVFDEGLAELVNVQGHWKGGPCLIMKD
ncbi:hypothetical protein TWF730_002758 [Orbilia blumenaviensis]|uniref:F-box domain-containing protein n=1 Tax=Orbilia blumenaviensis TaxID=1796055 RepID=A0AAV9UB10_9PEZI